LQQRHDQLHLLLVLAVPQVVSISDARDGRLSVTYAPTAPTATAAGGSTAAAASGEQQQQQQLVVDALVLATGGFGASKEMLRVRALGVWQGVTSVFKQFKQISHVHNCCVYAAQQLKSDAAAAGLSPPTHMHTSDHAHCLVLPMIKHTALYFTLREPESYGRMLVSTNAQPRCC
jgi:hypothetical protein